MKRGVLIGVLCLVGSTFLSATSLPTMGAQGDGWGETEGFVQDHLDFASSPPIQIDNGGSGWGIPVLLETDPNDVASPALAVDPSGNAMAVWTQSGGAGNSLWASRYVVGTGWGTPEVVQPGPESPWVAQVDFDPSGNAMAVWYQFDGVRTSIWANRFVVGTGWGTSEIIETGDTGDALSPQVAVDATGNAVAVWDQWDGPRSDVWANRYVVGTGWGAAELLETGAGNAFSPQVAVDSGGNAMAVWFQYDGPRGSAWANRYVVGTGWGTAELLETDDTGDSVSPRVTVDASGDVIAVWRQSDGSTFWEIWSNRYAAGTGWGSVGPIATTSGEDGNPEVAVDPNGNAIAVWVRTTSQSWSAWANRYLIGTGWGTEAAIETNDTGFVNPPQVAVDPSGNAIAVWGERNPSRVDVWANRFVVGTGWGTAELIETNDTGEADNTYVEVDSSGNAITLWRQWDGAFWNLWANRYIAPDRTPPVADAGPDQVVTASTLVTFDGSGSTDNVAITNYTWTFDDAGTRTLFGVAPVYTFGNGGIFVVTLRVWDADGNSDTDTVTISVNPPPDAEPPVAEAGPDQFVVTGTLVTFDGSGSTDNIGVTNYTWTFADGGTRFLYGVAPGYRFDNAGGFVVTLTVRDAAGNGDTDTVTITVDPDPDTEPPVATAGPDQVVTAGALMTFDGSGSTDNVGIVAYRWTFDDGGLRTLSDVSPTYTFTGEGLFVVTLTASDAAGNSGTDAVTITVNPAPDTQRPIAAAGSDRTVTAGTVVTLDGSGSTDNVGVTNYSWTFDDGGIRILNGVSPAHRFDSVGVFDVTLTVKDAAGNLDDDVVVITVTSPPDTEPPMANAGPDQAIPAGTTTVLDGSASADDLGIENYTWSFNDGGAKVRYAATFAYQFNNVGAITVTLTVRDAAGSTDADTVVITVTSPPDTEPPVANAGPDQSVAAGTLVTFDGSGSADNVGIVYYAWTFDDGGARTLFGVSPTYRFDNVGAFAVILTVRDAAGSDDSDGVFIAAISLPDVEPPVAEAGPARTVLAGATIILDGSESTDNVGIENYTWSFNDGGAKVRYAATFAYEFNNVGLMAVTLTVRDAAGNSDSDIVVITVTAPDAEPPVANAGADRSVMTGTLVTFNGSGSTDNAAITEYTWAFDDAGTRTLYGASPTYRFDHVGAFVVVLFVRDAAGNSDSDTAVIAVTAPDTEPPIAHPGLDQSVYTDVTVVLDGAGSTDNVGVANHTWTFVYDGTVRMLYGPVVASRFELAGSYTVTLEVRDAAGNRDTETVTITSSVRQGSRVTEVVPPAAIAGIGVLTVLVMALAIRLVSARLKRREVPAMQKPAESGEPKKEEAPAQEESESDWETDDL